MQQQMILQDKNNLIYKEYKNKDHGFNGELELVIDDIIAWFNDIKKNKDSIFGDTMIN